VILQLIGHEEQMSEIHLEFRFHARFRKCI